MTRTDAIAFLSSLETDETLGLGGYYRSAAYKLINGDTTPEELRTRYPDDAQLDAALSILGDTALTWDETEY